MYFCWLYRDKGNVQYYSTPHWLRYSSERYLYCAMFMYRYAPVASVCTDRVFCNLKSKDHLNLPQKNTVLCLMSSYKLLNLSIFKSEDSARSYQFSGFWSKIVEIPYKHLNFYKQETQTVPGHYMPVIWVLSVSIQRYQTGVVSRVRMFR